MPGASVLVALCGALLLCIPGLRAEETSSPCYLNPCSNNGECHLVEGRPRGDNFQAYYCSCPQGFIGTHCEAMCAMPLGMESGSIMDSQISASSVHMGFLGLQRWAPELARLHRTGIVNAWTASNYDRNPWIQVNLLRKLRVTGVVTQGASRTGSAEYLKSFKMAYSLDGRKFEYIKGDNGQTDKIFVGNVDNNGLKVNMFQTPLEAQYLRLVPIICHRGCTLRFELLGCELSGCADPLGMGDNHIPDKQITASSVYRTWGLSAFSWFPFYGRLDRQGKFNAWTAQSNSASEWLQIDLGAQKRVTGIITQGARDFGHVQYVAAYKVAYSDNGMNWTEYRDTGTSESKIFPGNLDNESHKKNMFEDPFQARFVRILPVAWHNRITLRVELLGC